MKEDTILMSGSEFGRFGRSEDRVLVIAEKSALKNGHFQENSLRGGAAEGWKKGRISFHWTIYPPLKQEMSS